MTSECLHPSVRSHAIAADKFGTLATKCFHLRSGTQFAHGFHFSMRFLHFCTQFFHSVDEKRRGQLIGVILRQNCSPSALGARKGAVGPCSEGQLSDALLAVVVEAREDLGIAEVLLTNGTGDLLLQLLQPFLHGIRSFRHHKRTTVCSFFWRSEDEPPIDQLLPLSSSAHVQMNNGTIISRENLVVPIGGLPIINRYSQIHIPHVITDKNNY